MGRRLVYPWYLHLPLLLPLALVAYKAARILPQLPPSIPLHFDSAGRPNGWGSPLVLASTMLLFPFFTGVIMALKEIFARHERMKSFNWFILAFTPLLGFFTVLFWLHLDFVLVPGSRFTLPWAPVLLAAASLTGIEAALEYLRPHVPAETPGAAGGEADYISSFEQRLRAAGSAAGAGKDFVYWEAQNPLWARVALVGLAALLLLAGFLSLSASTALTVLMWAIAPFAVSLAGGLRYLLTPGRLLIRLGRFGLTIRRIELASISLIEVRSFNPIRDFGGWGIRVGRDGVRGYFYQGAAGVYLELKDGGKLLLGSDNPARLAAVLKCAAREQHAGGS